MTEVMTEDELAAEFAAEATALHMTADLYMEIGRSFIETNFQEFMKILKTDKYGIEKYWEFNKKR